MNDTYILAAVFIFIFFIFGVLSGSQFGINIKGKSGASGVLLFFFFLGFIILMYFMGLGKI